MTIFFEERRDQQIQLTWDRRDGLTSLGTSMGTLSTCKELISRKKDGSLWSPKPYLTPRRLLRNIEMRLFLGCVVYNGIKWDVPVHVLQSNLSSWRSLRVCRCLDNESPETPFPILWAVRMWKWFGSASVSFSPWELHRGGPDTLCMAIRLEELWLLSNQRKQRNPCSSARPKIAQRLWRRLLLTTSPPSVFLELGCSTACQLDSAF